MPRELYVTVNHEKIPIEVEDDAKMLDVVEQISTSHPELIGKVFKHGIEPVNYSTSLDDAGIGSESNIEVNIHDIDPDFKKACKDLQREQIRYELNRLEAELDSNKKLDDKKRVFRHLSERLDNNRPINNERQLAEDASIITLEEIRKPRTALRSALWKLLGNEGKNSAQASSGEAIDRIINIGKSVNSPQNYKKERTSILEEIRNPSSNKDIKTVPRQRQRP